MPSIVKMNGKTHTKRFGRPRALNGSAVIGSIWAILVVAGFVVLEHYANTPGASANAPKTWPSASAIRPDDHQSTLVMFLHPQCPCSRASMAELEKFQTSCADRVKLNVVLIKPEGMPADWEKTDLWRTAQSIPGANVIIDKKGTEAERFHVQTSGQILLYDSHHNLVFEGGITSGRGHEGDNAGLDALKKSALADGGTVGKSSVFGCPLFSNAAEKDKTTCSQ